MSKIKRFHINTDDIKNIKTKHDNFINNSGDVFREEKKGTIYLVGVNANLTEDQKFWNITTFGLFKLRKKMSCAICGKTINKGTYGIGVLQDYQCMPSYWGYNHHICISCGIEYLDNKPIIECDRWCNLEGMNDHRTSTFVELLKQYSLVETKLRKEVKP